MSDDTLRTDGDPALDDALERFERAEAELEATEDRRRRLAEEAACAAAELESTLDRAIRSSIAQRDRLEDELAAVTDHIARLESIRARSSGRNTEPVITAGPSSDDAPHAAAGADDHASAEGHWLDLSTRREDSALSP